MIKARQPSIKVICRKPLSKIPCEVIYASEDSPSVHTNPPEQRCATIIS
jgi:hypothetical protein